jgi:hypothetical protein
MALVGSVFPNHNVIFIPRKSLPFVWGSVCLLYLACGVECLIRNPNDSLLHSRLNFFIDQPQEFISQLVLISGLGLEKLTMV